MKKILKKLSESDLHRIIKNVINEEINNKEENYHSEQYRKAVDDICSLTNDFVDEFENKFKQYCNTLPKEEADFFEEFINENGNYKGNTALEMCHNFRSWINNVSDEVNDDSFYV